MTNPREFICPTNPELPAIDGLTRADAISRALAAYARGHSRSTVRGLTFLPLKILRELELSHGITAPKGHWGHTVNAIAQMHREGTCLSLQQMGEVVGRPPAFIRDIQLFLQTGGNRREAVHRFQVSPGAVVLIAALAGLVNNRDPKSRKCGTVSHADILNCFDTGEKISVIAQAAGVNYESIRQVCIQYGRQIRRPRVSQEESRRKEKQERRMRSKALRREALMQRLGKAHSLWQSGCTYEEICAMYGWTLPWFEKQSAAARRLCGWFDQRPVGSLRLSITSIVDKFLNGVSVPDIAEQAGTSSKRVRRLIRDADVKHQTIEPRTNLTLQT